MTDVVLDASAILAALNDEPGGEAVTAAAAEGAVTSAINLAEVVTKLIVRGVPDDRAIAAATLFAVRVVAADQQRAIDAGRLHAHTRAAGISLADAFCLSLAADHGAKALTTDRAWSKLAIGVEVALIR